MTLIIFMYMGSVFAGIMLGLLVFRIFDYTIYRFVKFIKSMT